MLYHLFIIIYNNKIIVNINKKLAIFRVRVEVNLIRLFLLKGIFRVLVDIRNLIRKYRKCFREAGKSSVISVAYLQGTIIISLSPYSLSSPSRKMILVSCRLMLFKVNLKSRIISLKLGL